MNKKERPFRRSLILIFAMLATVLVYAYGFEKTDVNLDEIQSPIRQASLVRVLRALAHPDLVTYDRVDTEVVAPIYTPCPEGGFEPPAPDTSGAYLVVTPACADPRTEVKIEGFNFEPAKGGPIYFLGATDSGGSVRLQMGNMQADGDGYFSVTLDLKNRPSDQEQAILSVTRENVGSWLDRAEVWDDTNGNGVQDPDLITERTRWSPRASDTAVETWEGIVETVFMALLATTIGTILAVPLSFFAARNLMKNITTPVITVALGVIAFPFGVAIGIIASRAARWIAGVFDASAWTDLLGLAVLGAGVLFLLRVSVPEEEEERVARTTRFARIAGLLAAAFVAFSGLYVLADLFIRVGDSLVGNLGGFDFFGRFLANLGDIAELLVVLFAALVGGFGLVGVGTRIGHTIEERTPEPIQTVLRYPLAAASGALVAVGIGWLIEWLYQLDDAVKTFWIPAAVGAAFALWAAWRNRERDDQRIGLTSYYVARTFFNALRSMEPLVMVIVFVIWVGIGPFAGALALGLHTTVALAKLYSEQVESISEGPLEAVSATGATRLQTIIYAVLPQVVPPYISFTLYRWDINVRMSTIIGFAGGGGVGLILQQNVTQLNYRAASVQMLAIAIVVSSLDFLSARIRERIV
ncbi:MAG: ABC transporter permease subunit [Acidimicrobiia bacterium]|nr:ABC transporter permease subunit [Acidimicrobiia bacterium]